MTLGPLSRAQTGSGKTLAFGLPMIQRLLEERPELLSSPKISVRSRHNLRNASSAIGASGFVNGDVIAAASAAASAAGDARPSPPLFALVVTPTRELAAQVADHLRAVAPPSVVIVNVVGGMSIEKQRRLISHAPPIVVATPGRLWELITDGTCPHLSHLGQLRVFVLDEVDRMVEQVRRSASECIRVHRRAYDCI